jgi:hypothetical protein
LGISKLRKYIVITIRLIDDLFLGTGRHVQQVVLVRPKMFLSIYSLERHKFNVYHIIQCTFYGHRVDLSLIAVGTTRLTWHHSDSEH